MLPCLPSPNLSRWFPEPEVSDEPWHRRVRTLPWWKPCPNIFRSCAIWPGGFGTKPDMKIKHCSVEIIWNKFITSPANIVTHQAPCSAFGCFCFTDGRTPCVKIINDHLFGLVKLLARYFVWVSNFGPWSPFPLKFEITFVLLSEVSCNFHKTSHLKRT